MKIKDLLLDTKQKYYVKGTNVLMVFFDESWKFFDPVDNFSSEINVHWTGWTLSSETEFQQTVLECL